MSSSFLFSHQNPVCTSSHTCCISSPSHSSRLHYKHKRQRRRQVEQHTHTQGLRTDTTHIRPPDQRIPHWYYTQPTRTTDRAITTTENHQPTITSKKKGPKAKIKKQGYTVSQGRVKQKPHTGGKSKIPGKLKRKGENKQHSPPHSITTKSPPRSSNPRSDRYLPHEDNQPEPLQRLQSQLAHNFNHSNKLNRTSLSIQHPTILTLRGLMSYIYGAPILDVSRSHTTTQHSR